MDLLHACSSSSSPPGGIISIAGQNGSLIYPDGNIGGLLGRIVKIPSEVSLDLGICKGN